MDSWRRPQRCQGVTIARCDLDRACCIRAIYHARRGLHYEIVELRAADGIELFSSGFCRRAAMESRAVRDTIVPPHHRQEN
jgi:hypothetical protein